MNDLRGRVDAKGALEGVPSVYVRDARPGNVGAIKENVHRSGQQMIITGVLHCALFKAISNDTSRVLDRITHLKISDGGFSWRRDMRHSGFQR